MRTNCYIKHYDQPKPMPQSKPPAPKKEPAKRGRPVKNDIMNLQRSIPATPEKLAKAILTTPPRKTKS